jgi:cytochrome c biogenesis protein CcmG, thiol:disulfide interchange protein DsbE
MNLYRPRGAAKLARPIGLVLLAGAAIYAFSPALRNQFGSVRPQAERVPAEGFTLHSLNGENWSLQQQRGKVVLVNFWATWCPPCRIETPSLVGLHAKYANRGFTVAGITMDEDPAVSVPDFVRTYGINYPILTPSPQLSLADRVEALPTSILIDKAGRIARTYVGLVTERGLTDDIEALLAEKDGGA